MPATTTDTPTPAAASLASAGLQAVALFVPPPGANILRVGADQPFTTLASALAVARDGDVLLVQAGTYVNDFARIAAKVSIVGVGGMVNLVATVPPPDGKAILTVDADALIENVSFTGARVADENGAGIRYEAGDLTLRNCSFHDNENGLMGGAPNGTLLIQHCDFGHNGNGNGLTHNLYAGAIKQLTIEDSRFHDAVVGHEIKSRAFSTTITGTIVSDGPSGTASYSIDLPNGGKAVVRGNLIQKGPQAENQAIIHFGGESIPYAGSALLVEGNQVINDRGAGAIGVLNHTAIPATITGNSFTRLDPARVAQGPARIGSNLDSPGADGMGTALPDAVLSGVLPGRTQVFTDALDHQVTMTAGDTAVQGGAGRLQVLATGHVIVQGGAGGLDFSEMPGAGGSQVTTAEGSTNSIGVVGQDSLDSRGADSITTGGGNVSAQVSGSAVVNEGAGNNQWSVLGTLRLTGHGGAPRINLDAGANVTLDGALNFFAIQSNGGSASYDLALGGKPVQASLTGGAWSMYGSEGNASVTTARGPDGVLMRFGAGQVQVVSGGRDVIWAGPGATVIQASGAAEIHAGTGALALYSRGWSGANLWGAGGNYVIGGDTGGITYHGGDQASTVQADLSRITLLGDAGRLTVQAGMAQTIIGGAGGLTVTETGWSGGNTITTRAGSINTVSLTNGTLDSWGHDTITQPGGNNTLSVHGDAVIQGSTGNSRLSVFGHAALTGRGGDCITLAPGADATVQAGHHLDVSTTQASLTVTAPEGDASLAALTIQGGAATAVVSEGRTAYVETRAVPGGTRVAVDGGTSEIWTWGADQIHADAGTAAVMLCATGAEVWGGSGRLIVSDRHWTGEEHQTIHGGSGSLAMSGGWGDITYIGGDGAAVLDTSAHRLTILGGAGSVTASSRWIGTIDFTGGSGDAALTLGDGGGTVVFGTGSTAVHELGWGGAVSYTAGTGGGTQTITGFRPGTDSLHLAGTALAGQVSDGTATTLTTTAGARIVLAGVTMPVELIVDPAPLLNPTLPPVPAPVTLPQSDSLAEPSQGAPAHDAALPATASTTTGHVAAPAASSADAPHSVEATLSSAALPAAGSGPVSGEAPVLPVPPAAVPDAQASSAGPASNAAPTLQAPPAAGAAPAPAADAQALHSSQAAAASASLAPDAGAIGALVAAAVPMPQVPPAAGDTPASTDIGSPPQPVPATDTAASQTPAIPLAFAVIETTTGQSAHSDGEAYAGPVTFLQRQFIWSGDGGIVIAASTADVFLHSGGGDDALQAHAGSNVLDGGAGSNFLVGGAGGDGGADTFFVDGRGGQTWSTLVNFHHGDALTLWGFQPGVSTNPWTASDGAAGYAGATLHSELVGAGTGVSASATFAGLTLDDVQSKLSVSSGTVGGLSYLNVAYTG